MSLYSHSGPAWSAPAAWIRSAYRPIRRMSEPCTSTTPATRSRGIAFRRPLLLLAVTTPRGAIRLHGYDRPCRAPLADSATARLPPGVPGKTGNCHASCERQNPRAQPHERLRPKGKPQARSAIYEHRKGQDEPRHKPIAEEHGSSSNPPGRTESSVGHQKDDDKVDATNAPGRRQRDHEQTTQREGKSKPATQRQHRFESLFHMSGSTPLWRLRPAGQGHSRLCGRWFNHCLLSFSFIGRYSLARHVWCLLTTLVPPSPALGAPATERPRDRQLGRRPAWKRSDLPWRG